jgi:hypothetical protein
VVRLAPRLEDSSRLAAPGRCPPPVVNGHHGRSVSSVTRARHNRLVNVIQIRNDELVRFEPVRDEPRLDFCNRHFKCRGARPGDRLADKYPGIGAVTNAWRNYSAQPSFSLSPLPTAPQLETEGP